ncbi:MAG: lysine exporter LysO family protein [Proteocatella sp.]
MTWMPFLCLGTGFVLGLNKWVTSKGEIIDLIINISLVLLMFTIGANIGTSQLIMENLFRIGMNCAVIALMAILCSIICTVIVESTFLHLDEIADKLSVVNSKPIASYEKFNQSSCENQKSTILLWLMPVCVGLGIVAGKMMIKTNISFYLNYFLYFSLTILYTGVGVSLSCNRNVFKYVEILGWRIILISIATFAGSILGGFAASIVLDLPVNIPVMSAAGMSYYSVTGAYMSQVYGAEIGMYGFMVNVMREFFVVMGLPLIIKISKGSAISAGASGDMDTMLVPVTKFAGVELGLVTLITGTILTFAVPFILPILYNLFLII